MTNNTRKIADRNGKPGLNRRGAVSDKGANGLARGAASRRRQPQRATSAKTTKASRTAAKTTDASSSIGGRQVVGGRDGAGAAHKHVKNVQSHPSSSSYAGVLGALLLVVLVAAAGGWVWSCSSKKDDTTKPSSTRTSAPARSIAGVKPAGSVTKGAASALVSQARPLPSSQPPPEPAEKGPWQGPWVGALVPTAPVYTAMFRSREYMIGYMRYGTKAPAVDGKALKKDNCKEGWLRLHPYGYICGRHATANMNNPQFVAGITPPDLEATVPYKYARNPKNGTPLYRRIPTAQEWAVYEPDRAPKTADDTRKQEDKAAAKPSKSDASADDDGGSGADGSSDKARGLASATARAVASAPAEASAVGTAAGSAAASAAAVAKSADEADVDMAQDPAEDMRPWWQRDDGKDKLNMDHMFEDSDSLLAMRMAKGFYVAIDKTFRKNGRLWHKTTDGVFAPSDKVSINSPPTFQGVELTGPNAPQLPIAWTRVKASKHYLSEDGESFRRKGTAERFTMLPLTGKKKTRGGTEYRETTQGWWVRSAQVRVTNPGPPPAQMRVNERWIDINLTTQTLVAFEGTKPVYATMISTGKKGATRKDDHSTVKGAFRVREKHVSAKMDGDGAGSGDTLYSIRDVPYVLYFERSYAIHGAFWHNNFGVTMSHGCVNLAPIDAKWVFFWSNPQIPEGWHGMWSNAEHPGSFVVVHD